MGSEVHTYDREEGRRKVEGGGGLELELYGRDEKSGGEFQVLSCCCYANDTTTVL